LNHKFRTILIVERHEYRASPCGDNIQIYLLLILNQSPQAPPPKLPLTTINPHQKSASAITKTNKPHWPSHQPPPHNHHDNNNENSYNVFELSITTSSPPPHHRFTITPPQVGLFSPPIQQNNIVDTTKKPPRHHHLHLLSSPRPCPSPPLHTNRK